jgi:hypothetical protein
MSTTLSNSVLESLLAPLSEAMSEESARRLIALRATPEIQSRVDELAIKAEAGTLSEEERDEYDELVRAGTLLATLQAKARQMLRGDKTA